MIRRSGIIQPESRIIPVRLIQLEGWQKFHADMGEEGGVG